MALTMVFLPSSSSGVSVRLDNSTVSGLLHEQIKFSVNVAGDSRDTEVFWEPSISFITPCSNGSYAVGLGRSTVTISSSIIGIFHLKFFTIENGERVYVQLEEEVEIVIGRDKGDQNILVNVFFSLGMGFALLIMGIDIDLDQVMEAVRRPIGPFVGFCSQFLAMPAISYLLGYLLLESRYERLGLLLLGCCPGGVGSNFWTAMLGGDINLSVTMTFFSSVAAFAMTSFWIWFLGSPLVDTTLPIPYTQLVIALISFALPVGLGILIRRRWPEKSLRVKAKIGRPLWLLMVLIIVVAGIVMNLFFFYLVTWRHLVAGACLGFLGYTFGATAAILTRMTKPQVMLTLTMMTVVFEVIAVAIETAIQNGGIGVVVLNLTFPSPYSDMALLPILAFFFCSAGPFLFFLYAVRQLVGKVRGKLAEVEEVEEKVEEKVNSFVSSPHVTKSHRVSMSGQTLEKETERLKSFSTESNSTL